MKDYGQELKEIIYKHDISFVICGSNHFVLVRLFMLVRSVCVYISIKKKIKNLSL